MAHLQLHRSVVVCVSEEVAMRAPKRVGHQTGRDTSYRKAAGRWECSAGLWGLYGVVTAQRGPVNRCLVRPRRAPSLVSLSNGACPHQWNCCLQMGHPQLRPPLRRRGNLSSNVLDAPLLLIVCDQKMPF